MENQTDDIKFTYIYIYIYITLPSTLPMSSSDIFSIERYPLALITSLSIDLVNVRKQKGYCYVW